jgi:hypothetical protein
VRSLRLLDIQNLRLAFDEEQIRLLAERSELENESLGCENEQISPTKPMHHTGGIGWTEMSGTDVGAVGVVRGLFGARPDGEQKKQIKLPIEINIHNNNNNNNSSSSSSSSNNNSSSSSSSNNNNNNNSSSSSSSSSILGRAACCGGCKVLIGRLTDIPDKLKFET